MNPLAVLIPALYAKLAGLSYGGQAVPVYEHLPKNSPTHYVLIEQPTDTDAGGSIGCAHYSCTVLLDVVTQFASDVVTSEPAEAIVSQIHARLRRQRLVLPAGWDCQIGLVEPATQLVELDGELLAIRRLLRYRWEVYYHGVPAPESFAARSLWAGGLREVHGGELRVVRV